MAYQYQTFGYVTKSMLLVNFFHFLYVLDFFYNEDWYLRTIDITHDHFGFTLAWGDTAFLPNRMFMYPTPPHINRLHEYTICRSHGTAFPPSISGTHNYCHQPPTNYPS